MRKIVLCCSVIFLCCHLSSSYAFMGMEKKQAELSHIQGHIEDLKKILNENKSRETQLQEQLKTTELALSQLSADVAALDKKIMIQETELEKITKTQQKYSQDLAVQRASLAEQIRLQYQLGKAQSVRNILNPENFSSINRYVYYYHYLSLARAKSVAEINQILEILTQNMQAMTTQENNLKNLRLQKQNQLHKAQAAQQKRQKIIAELDTSSQDKQQQLQTLLTNQSGLRNMITDLQKQTPEDLYHSFKEARGRLSWPIESHQFSQITNSHQNAVIIKAPEGTPVHAIYGGKVIFANWLRGFGLLIIINHGDGFMSLYARNHAIYAKVGDQVAPREVIASIGNTGGYSTSSLYFEIRQNGQPLNVKTWCN
jgi:septal ring factor EnvC (AmiA/AmiB activator)